MLAAARRTPFASSWRQTPRRPAGPPICCRSAASAGAQADGAGQEVSGLQRHRPARNLQRDASASTQQVRVHTPPRQGQARSRRRTMASIRVAMEPTAATPQCHARPPQRTCAREGTGLWVGDEERRRRWLGRRSRVVLLTSDALLSEILKLVVAPTDSWAMRSTQVHVTGGGGAGGCTRQGRGHKLSLL